LKVYKSNRAEKLLQALAQVLRVPLEDPLEPDVVVVPSRGMERWLALGLSQQLGVCANLRFPFPGKLVSAAFQAVLGEMGGRTRAWEPERLAWSVLAELPALLGEPAFAPLRAYLREEPGLQGAISFQLARRIAECFDRYLAYRHDLLRRWSAGEGRDWQALLWRRLEASVATPSLAALAPQFFQRLAAGLHPDELRDLPRRLCLFGVSSLPPFHLQVLAALGQSLQLHLFTLCPSQEYWGHVRSKNAIARQLARDAQVQRSADALYLEEGHPLLASLGRLGQDFQTLLEESAHYQEPQGSLFQDPLREGPSLLRQLQSDLLRMRSPAEGRHEADPSDRSIQVHACHGPMRQVEVLQDQLLDLFQRDPGLQPRDVVVLCSDLEVFAPLLEAVFGRSPSDERYIPFRIADRAQRQANALAEAFLRVLQLAGARASASQLLDLLGQKPLRTRFSITAEELELFGDWVQQSGIRWGRDAQHRAAHDQPAYAQNTWRFGLERLMLGYAMPGQEGQLFAGALPCDLADGPQGASLGKLADFCQALFAALEDLESGPRSMQRWLASLNAVADGLLATTDDEHWQRAELRALLERGVQDATLAGFEGELELAALMELLEAGLGRSLPSPDFLSGALTCCAMVPMRAIPFRVVCLLGMDDGLFPRRDRRPGFDLSLRDPRPGDRSQRDDDRQLFLEALLSARDLLLITTSGRNPRSNEPQPPSVVVSELLDALCQSFALRGAPAADRQALLAHIVLQHPLQAFSPACFPANGEGRIFSYAASCLQGAKALLGERQAAAPFLQGSLPSPPHQPVLSLDELCAFWALPARALLGQRLGLRLDQRTRSIEDREPLLLDGLQRYAVATLLLDRRLRGRTPQGDYAPLRAAGALPLGTPGRCELEALAEELDCLSRAALGHRGDSGSERLDLDLRLGPWRLQGVLDQVWAAGLVRQRYARPRAHQLLRLWLELLALQLQRRDQSWAGVLVQRAPRGQGLGAWRISSPAAPERLLQELLDLRGQGLQRALPFFPETSLAYARAWRQPGSEAQRRGAALRAARLAWHGSGDRAPGEGRDPHLQRIYGSAEPFRSASSTAPDPEFASLALRIWDPLLDCLELDEQSLV